MDKDLESLYKEAQSAFKAKDYEHASDLLRQILKVDVDYKDAAQLLARVIRLSRRRWYNDPRLWGALGVLLLVGLGIYLFPKLQGILYTQPTPAPVILPTGTPTMTTAPPATATATETLLPTPIPLTWKRVSIGQEFERDTVTAFVIDHKDPEVLYAGMKSAGFYQSIDGGISWRPLQIENVPANIFTKLSVNSDHNQERGYTVTNVAPDGKTRIYRYATPSTYEVSGTSNWRVSEDNGQTWSEFGLMGWPNSAAITFDSEGSVYTYCNSTLCKYSPDGKQTTKLGKPDVGAFTLIAISPHDPNTIYAAGKGLAVSKDEGRTWIKLNNGLGSGTLQLATSSEVASNLYLQSGQCGQALRTTQSRTERVFQDDAGQPLFVSTNGGQTWDLSLRNGCYLIKDANDSILYRVGQDWMYTTDGNHSLRWIWLSKDRGKSWQIADIMDIEEHFTIVTHPTQSGLVYLYVPGYEWDSEQFPPKELISEDYGHKWRRIDPPENAKNCYGSAPQFIDEYRPMAIDPFDGNHVFVIDNGILLESRNSCEATEIFATAPNLSMNSIAFDLKNSATLYAGTDEGAYISLDSGIAWNQINDGLLGATVVYSIAVDKDSNVYAATPYGIFKLENK